MTKYVLLTALLFCSRSALAQSADKESVAIIELGGATAVNIKDATPSAGPTLAVEVTSIEKWLELEAGVPTNTDVRPAPLVVKRFSTLCSGLRPSVDSVGIWNPPTGTTSGVDMNNRLASVVAS